MKIIRFKQTQLRNREDFQHKTEIQTALQPIPNLVAQNGINPLVGQFNTSYDKLKLSIEKITKSALTNTIEDADKYRDQLTSGLFGQVKSACNHYDPELRQYAIDLEVICSHYSDIMGKSYQEQTGATTNLVADLRTQESKLGSLNLAEWVNRLETKNREFEQLVAGRQHENAEKPQTDNKEIRRELDVITETIYKAIETFAVLEPDNIQYSQWITDINAINKEYKNLIATREGRAAANNEELKTKTEQ